MLNHAMQGVRQLINHNKHPHNATDTNPFGKALDTPDDIVGELTRNAIKLNPLIKRHIIKGFEGVPNTLQLGWAQLPQTQGKASPSAYSPTPTTSHKSRSPTTKRASSQAPILKWTCRNWTHASSSSKRRPSLCRTAHDSVMLRTARQNGTRITRRCRRAHARRTHDVARVLAQGRQPLHA